ncbi:HNH endonuclease signature motif containing protein [Nocardiopsis dassonvillei]|uniref:HNH endonuclease signature motif containing protein n=1 Tax=Nocardiopsis dassonvillei TaxID=2014 RepID=UPI003637955A
MDKIIVLEGVGGQGKTFAALEIIQQCMDIVVVDECHRAMGAWRLLAWESSRGQGDGYLGLAGSTDRMVLTRQRVEQAMLRSAVLRGREKTECALCGQVNQKRYIRTAHIKPRSACSPREREHLANVMPACVTCDALFENGDIRVDDSGVISVGPGLDEGNFLYEWAYRLQGRTCSAYRTENRRYFEFRASHVRP